MSEKKVYGRTFVIVLGIICIISLSGLAAVIMYYSPEINNKNNIIQTQYDELYKLHSWFNQNITDYENQISCIKTSQEL